MFKKSFAASLLVLALLACAGPSLAELSVGQEAPDFRLVSLDGEEFALSELRGETVVIEWINPNCPVSLRHADEKTMISTSDRHPDAVWLAINSTNSSHGDYLEPAEHAAYNRSKEIDYPVLYDATGDIGRAYGAKTTPHMFVIDAEGRLAYMGAIDDAPRGRGASVNYVESALEKLASGGRPEPSSTRPYGCSVKY